MGKGVDASGEKVRRYVVTTIGGLEEVVLDELREVLGPVKQIRTEKGRRHGRIFFTYERSPRRLTGLRAVDSCAAVLCEMNGVTVGRPGLDYIAERLSRVDLSPAVRLHRATSAQVGGHAAGGQLTVTMSGSYRFNRAELARRAERALATRGLVWSDAPEDLRLLLQLQGKRALLTLRLPLDQGGFSWRFRGLIDGPLAHCLTRLLGIGESDLAVGVGCSDDGLEEIAAVAGPYLLFGLTEGDQAATKRQIRVQKGAGWPLGAGCIDCLLGMADREGVDTIGESARTLRPGGIAGLLTAHPAALLDEIAHRNLPVDILATVPIYLRARQYQFLIVERLEEIIDSQGLIDIDQAPLKDPSQSHLTS